MPIKPAPLKAKPSVLSDWIELTILASSTRAYRLAYLKRFRDTHRETEDSDSEGKIGREEDTDAQGVDGGDDDVFIDEIAGEIADREHILGDSYPFEFSSSGLKLKLKSDLSDGAYIYIFCLLISNPKADDILDGKWLPHIDNDTRDLFQVCATMAAAGEVVGSAISFGWPRPYDNPPFLQKLREVYELFGEGELVLVPRRGVSPSPKDAEIDIIAWRPTYDRAPGKPYLLGQVASGGNWRGKSMVSAIGKFHDNWFTRHPASTATASIFIPHDIQSELEGDRYDLLHAEVPAYGTIFDRLRLPRRANEGIKLADNNPDLTIERRDEVPNVISWVEDQLLAFRNTFEASLNA